MNPRRQAVLDAAIDVLGRGGSRALTHRAVDDAADLPVGSTSNYFRTRDALVDGIVTRLEERDIEQWQDAPVVHPGNPAEFARLLTQLVTLAVTSDRVRTQARYALFVEGMISGDDSPITHSLHRGRDRLAGFCREILSGLGAAEPVRAARGLVDLLDGMIMHQLTGSATSPADLHHDIAAAVDRLLR